MNKNYLYIDDRSDKMIYNKLPTLRYFYFPFKVLKFIKEDNAVTYSLKTKFSDE